MPDLIPVLLRRAVGSLNPGEVAGFLQEKANDLVKSGAAELYIPAGAETMAGTPTETVVDDASGADTITGSDQGSKRRR